MRARVAGLTASLLLGALLLLALDRSGRAPAPAAPVPAGASAAPSAAPHASGDPAPSRDIFQYADGGDSDADVRPPAPVENRPPDDADAPSLPEAPRLVGVVRRGGAPSAALAVGGDVVLLAPGQSAAGVMLIAIEGDAVRIRTAEGREITLVPSE